MEGHFVAMTMVTAHAIFVRLARSQVGMRKEWLSTLMRIKHSKMVDSEPRLSEMMGAYGDAFLGARMNITRVASTLQLLFFCTHACSNLFSI
jgi:hypothetical protein